MTKQPSKFRSLRRIAVAAEFIAVVLILAGLTDDASGLPILRAGLYVLGFSLVIRLYGVGAEREALRAEHVQRAWAERHYRDPHRIAIAETVAKILCEELSVSVDSLEPNTQFIRDLRCGDDLEDVLIARAAEDAFSIAFTVDELTRIATIDDLINGIAAKTPG